MLYSLQPGSISHFPVPLIRAEQQLVLATEHVDWLTLNFVVPIQPQKIPTKKKRDIAMTAMRKMAWTAMALGI